MSDITSPTKAAAERSVEGTRTVPVFTPATEIYETSDALVLSLEMPGVDPDGVNITLDNRILTVTGRSKSTAPSGYALAHAEFREGDYERSFTLSEAIAGARIEASMRDGVLRLTLPKEQPAPAKTISVKAG
jgi:HSP20 family molecular chaperone IbpA